MFLKLVFSCLTWVIGSFDSLTKATTRICEIKKIVIITIDITEKASLGVIHYNDQFSIKEKGNKISIRTTGCDLSMVPSPERVGYEMDSTITDRGSASITFVEITPGYDRERMNKLKV